MLLKIYVLKSYQMFTLAVTVSQKIKFKIFELGFQGQGGDKWGTYNIRSQMFECVLLNFFILLASGNMKTNEF